MEMEKKKTKLTQKNKMEEVINIFNETWRLASFNQPKNAMKPSSFNNQSQKSKRRIQDINK